MTPDDLIEFEEEMAELFAAGEIRSPLHLAGGNENNLIEIFRDIRPQDWVLGSWRSHYHALLKGVPRDEVRRAILNGRSIALCFPFYKVLCSAIVGGIAPIAIGIAWAIKKEWESADHVNGDMDRVYVFLGDMTAECGVVHEAMKYAEGHKLPVTWIVEDNGLSVKTDTRKVWGVDACTIPQRYRYTMTKPHVGIDRWVAF